MVAPKMGRPTDSPKDYMLRVRLDAQTLAMLDACCEENGTSRSEVVREGIKRQYADLKK